MCEWGTTKHVWVTIPADLSYTGKERTAYRPIDSCIAPIVEALQKNDVLMRGSCCGHGKADGEIELQDGRVLIIKRNADV